MKADVNPGHIKHIGDDMYKMSKMISRIICEIEDVENGLRKQSVFHTHLKALKKAGRRIEEERNKVVVLAQALANIGSSYSQTETVIENQFDHAPKLPGYHDVTLIELDLINLRLKHLLYGGEEHGDNI